MRHCCSDPGHCLIVILITFTSAIVLSCPVQNSIAVDLKIHCSLQLARSRWDPIELKLAQQMIVLRHRALSLDHLDVGSRLVVLVSGQTVVMVLQMINLVMTSLTVLMTRVSITSSSNSPRCPHPGARTAGDACLPSCTICQSFAGNESRRLGTS